MTDPMDWLHTGAALHGGIARDAFAQLGGRELRPGDRLGPFAITSELGRGGMAIVYAAERADGEFEQLVAIKWMPGSIDSAEAAALFRRERQILAELRHSNIARLLDGGRTDDGMLWFAMERVEGLRLDHHLAAGQARTLPERLAILRQICAALTFAHGRGLVHRDLKPGNIAIDGDGSVKLLDFGVALWLEHNPDSLRHAYTPAWASPEQLRGEATGTASDIYQLGLLLRWLRTDIMAPPSGLPGRELDAITTRATAAAPEQRYASVAEFQRDLDAWRDRRPVAAHAGGLRYPMRLFLQRHALASVLTATAALLLITLSADFAWRLKQERDRAVAQARRADATRDFLVSLFRGADPTARKGLNLTARDLLDRGEARIVVELADQPELRAELQETLASVYNFLAEHDRAERLIRAALTHSPGSDDDRQHRLDRARRLLLLASVHNRAARPADALPETDTALALLSELDGEQARELELSAWNARAMAFKNLERGADAAQALEQLLARVDASPKAAEHRAYAADNLAHVYEVQGRWSEALVQAEVAELAFLSLRGGDSPEPWAVAGYRAGLEYATGDFDAARARYGAVLAAQQRLYDAGDRRIMNSQTALARVALAQHDLAAADALLTAALSECERQFGSSHRECPLTWQLWGELRLHQNDRDHGLRILREAVALRELGPSSHRAVALAQVALATALCRDDGDPEGRAVLAKAAANLKVTPPAPLDLTLLAAAEVSCGE